MGWASESIARLQNGETVQFRPRGNSMKSKIESGQLCTVEPVVPATLKVGDIVLCKVNGKQYLHLVKAIQGKRFQIGYNRGRTCFRVEKAERLASLYLWQSLPPHDHRPRLVDLE